MANGLIGQVAAAMAEFSGVTRLIDLRIGERDEYGLLVEAFAAEEAIQEVGLREVIALSTSAHIPVTALLGKPAILELSLANGERTRFSGEICDAAVLGSDGGLARYQDDSNVRTHTFELETMRSIPGKPKPRISRYKLLNHRGMACMRRHQH